MRLMSVRNMSLAVVAAVSLSGCDNGPSVTTTPTPPTPEVTESFSGTLTKNGGLTHPFVAAGAGTVTATATTLDPADAKVGVALGTWNGVACAIVIANDQVVLGTVVIGTANAAGTLCVRIYDAAGTLAQDTGYTLTVVHR